MNKKQKKKWARTLERAKQLREEAEERNAKMLSDYEEVKQIYRRKHNR